MEFGLKRVIAAVRVVAALKRLYRGEPITVQAMSTEVKLSQSYLEQIFAKLRTAGIVTSARGPGGGYSLPRSEEDISVASVIRAVTNIPVDCEFQSVLEALDSVSVTQLSGRKENSLAA
ncbi:MULTISPECIES: Rrf2 family transcriptional regulator [Enterobacteriaceae]|nr:Rrf2 family transcriptional regulator [Kosakonia oryzendophytica]WBT56639.1 Rrf2 family transcriptional regulator [Kosakonia oryzendophytica]